MTARAAALLRQADARIGIAGGVTETRSTASDRPAAPAAVLIGCGAATPSPGPEAIGFKAHNLARMAAMGLPVPEAFVLGTAWCRRERVLPRTAWQPALQALQDATGLALGDARRPLLLAVRSGAPVSMPGMMDTVLNIGLCDASVRGLVRRTGNPRLAWDAYRRLVAGYGEVVLGIEPGAFEADLAAVAGGRDERTLDYAELRALTRRHLDTVARLHDQPFPQDPLVQLECAMRAVFASWWSRRASTWRALQGLSDELGTAVTVQRMVFGNAGGTSGAGVGFTRHPATGEPQPWIDFLFNAQGEDVVAGRRQVAVSDDLARVAPHAWQALADAAQALERTLGDMQDFEFTVEEGRLYLLQTRNGRRTPLAAARIALDLHEAGIIDRAQAIERTHGLGVEQLSVSRIAGEDGRMPEPLARAQSACTGVASGRIALDEAAARRMAEAGEPVVLVRADAQTEDIGALELARGLLTARGARTSHAAVVARELGKVCLVGCEALQIDLQARRLQLAGRAFAEGDTLSLDGNEGGVHAGRLHTVNEVPEALLARLATLRTPAPDGIPPAP